jgi:hypothetical protein
MPPITGRFKIDQAARKVKRFADNGERGGIVLDKLRFDAVIP